MGIAERRERERQNRRKAIVTAAKRLIVRSGVEGMSMDQLARAVELNKATLYLYFESKADLIDAIAYEGLVLLEKELQEIEGSSKSGLDKVLTLARTTLAFYKQHPVYFHAMNHQERRGMRARQEAPLALKGDELSLRIFEIVANGLRQGIEEGSIREEIDIPMFPILLFSHTYGFMHTLYAKPDVYKDVLNLDPERIERSASEIIEHYLRR